MYTANPQSGLPGGLPTREGLRRDFSFRPLDGELEMQLSGNKSPARTFPEGLSELLAGALQSLAGEPVSREQVCALSVGDRQFLVRELAAMISPGPQWLSAECKDCGEAMDACFHYADLPVKQAGTDYPVIRYSLGGNELSLRVPTGADQEAIAGAEDDEQALALLLSRISGSTQHYSAAQIAELESALESVAPEVGNCLLVNCPHCAAANTLTVDMYGFLPGLGGDLLVEVHQIASHYHWSEDSILRLPRERRKRYLSLIDRSRGMTGSDG